MKVRINDREYAAELDNFTLGEAREIKRVCGLPLGRFQDAIAESDPDALAAFVWVCVRRENPRITMEEIDAQGIAELIVDDEPSVEADAVPPIAGEAASSS